jgi:PhnB protein
MISVNPYLGFDGTCEEAFEHYRSIFGGELMISRYSDMPPDTPVDPADAGKVMHVSLPLSEGQALMGSDRPPGTGTTTFGDSVAVSVSPASADEGRRIFEALADGGLVLMPYEHQFWGADYGMCRDRFGINWMVNYQEPDAG